MNFLVCFLAISLQLLQVRGGKVASSLFSGGKLNANKEPLMVRAAKGEAVERVPIWIMRQAGLIISI